VIIKNFSTTPKRDPSDPEMGYTELFISTKKSLLVVARNLMVRPKIRGYLLDYTCKH